MKSELLIRIKDAEAAVGQRAAQADVEAKAIIADAKRQAEALVQEGRAQTDFAYNSRIEQARAAGETAAKRTVASGQKQAEAARKKFEAGVAGATDRALKIIEGRLA